MRIESFTISGVSFDECYKERVEDILDGVEVSLISLKHLKKNKKASAGNDASLGESNRHRPFQRAHR